MADVPTVAEQGVTDFDYVGWIGIVAPAGTSDEVVNRISGELTKVLRSPDTVKRLAEHAIDTSVMTPTQMRDYMAAEYSRVAKVVAEAGIKE
jgi:tripartite-type tricarboxylate transporter receptor subunit TctC